MISVIIPTYNRDGVISRAINSVLKQTYQNFEVIIVDDNSPVTDNTACIISQYNDDRLFYIKHDKNKGGGGARNTGILAANGEYIAFLDSDDEWLPEKLQLQINLMRQVKDLHPKPVIYTQLYQKGKGFEWIKPKQKIKDGQRIGDYIFCESGYIQTSTIFLSTCLAKNTLFPEIKRHQDYEFCLSLEEKDAVFFMIEQPLVIFHQDQDCKSRTSSNIDWEYSVAWGRRNRYLLGEQPYNMFMIKNVIPKLVAASNYGQVFKFYKELTNHKYFIQVFLKSVVRKMLPASLVAYSRRFRV